MRQYLVTLKMPKNKDHDPQNKKTGVCPANPGKLCTDWTGEHHTVVGEYLSVLDAERFWRGQGIHVTRVEEA